MLDATVSMSFAVDVREEFTFVFSERKSTLVVVFASDDVCFFLFLVVRRCVSFREIIDVFRAANIIVFATHKGKGKATKTLKTKPKQPKKILLLLLFNDDSIDFI